MRQTGWIIAMLALAALVQPVFAYGLGTSSITLSRGTVGLVAGNSTSVNYTVNLVSGSPWGTTINVQNAAQLSQQGITVTLSHPENMSVPFSGVALISTKGNAMGGTYQILFNATGDDPTSAPTTLTLVLSSNPNQVSTTTISQNKSGTSAAAMPSYSFSFGSGTTALVLAIITIIVFGALAAFRKSRTQRLIYVGVALILLGTIAWLYGDFSQQFNYSWFGVGLLVLGIIVWLVGDALGHMLKGMALTTILIYVGVALLVIGTAVWLYGDFHASLLDLWAGVGAILLGTIVWLIGDYMGHML